MRSIHQDTPPKTRQLGRALLLRAAALLVGCLPLVAAELTLRACGLGQRNLHQDPFVGFNRVLPLFELNSAGDRYEIAPSRQSHFFPDSFAAAKPAGEFRVFCIGDSTVQGNPWSPSTSFTKWLEISL